MNRSCLLVIALAIAACKPADVPVEIHVVEAPRLLVEVPARLLLDIRLGVPTSGAEIAVESGAGLRVVDYAPRVLPASQPDAGSQLFVDLVPSAAGDRILTVHLTIHRDGDQLSRSVSLPLTVSSPSGAPQALERAPVHPGMTGSI